MSRAAHGRRLEDLGDHRDDQRRELSLAPRRGADVEGVRAAVKEALGAEAVVGGGEHLGGSGVRGSG